MNIKQATIHDVQDVVSIVKLYRSFYGVSNQSESDIEEFISQRIRNNESKIFLAYDHDKVIGFIQLYPTFSTVSLKPQWLLNDLFVKKEARSKGVATLLMKTVKEYFKDSSKGFILVTEKSNSTAKKFYDKCDFETDEYDFYTFFYK